MRGFPTRYIVFDTETSTATADDRYQTQTLRLRLGVGKLVEIQGDGTERVSWVEFEDNGALHDWVKAIPRGKDKVWIFAHNAGFDIRIIELFPYMNKGYYSLWDLTKGGPDRDWNEPLIVLENPPMMIRMFRPDGQELLWCDTFQWIAHSLKGMGEIMGFAKGVMPAMDAPLPEWWAYCRRDVEVLDAALKRIWGWLRENKVSSFHPTRAGQSRLIYREKYEQKRIKYHENVHADTIARHAYYGGHTDCFRTGTVEGPIYQLDINSLYPYVMRERWYPAELVETFDEFRDIGAYRNFPWKNAIAEVDLDTDDSAYPVRCREGTWFAKGHVRTTLCGPELQRARNRGHIIKVHKINTYHMVRLFDDFIRDYWGMRLAAKDRGDDVAQMVIKLLMNSLYGKFAQMTGDWVFSHDNGDVDDYSTDYEVFDVHGPETRVRSLGGKVFRQVGRDEARGSYIAIAAFVTSYARMLMEDMRGIAGETNCFYQATDSLYVNQTGYDRLGKADTIDPRTIGLFKHEATYKTCMFKNIHHIDKDDKQIRGSIRPNAERLGNDCFVVDQWESFKSGIFRGNVDRVLIRKIRKTMPGRYIRGYVHPDGRVEPWTIDNWDLPPEEQRLVRLPVA